MQRRVAGKRDNDRNLRAEPLCSTSAPVCQPICRIFFIHFTYTSQGLGRARPGLSQGSQLWPGLEFEKAKAASGQAKARALRPSQAETALTVALHRYCSDPLLKLIGPSKMLMNGFMFGQHSMSTLQMSE
jgi:hypothetical protein